MSGFGTAFSPFKRPWINLHLSTPFKLNKTHRIRAGELLPLVLKPHCGGFTVVNLPFFWWCSLKICSGWWLNQPIWKNMLLKMGIFPIIKVNIRHIWNHHPVLAETSWTVSIWNLTVPENERMSPEKGPFQKEITSSNHQFSEDMFQGTWQFSGGYYNR